MEESCGLKEVEEKRGISSVEKFQQGLVFKQPAYPGGDVPCTGLI